MKEQELLDLKQEIEDAKEEQASLKGELQALMRQLKEDHACKTVKEAQQKLKMMDEEITSLQKQLNKGIVELEELMEKE